MFEQSSDRPFLCNGVIGIEVGIVGKPKLHVYLFGRIHQPKLVHVGTFDKRKPCVELNDRLTLLPLLCGDNNHSVGRPRTVDGCSSSIFEDGDVGDVARIDSGNGGGEKLVDVLVAHIGQVGAAEWHSVHHPERILRPIQRSCPSDADLDWSTWRTAERCGLHSCHLAVEHHVDAGNTSLNDVLGLHSGNCRCELSFLYLLIPVHHHRGQGGSFGLFHRDGHKRLVADADLLRLVTDKAASQVLHIFGDRQGKSTVFVGCGSDVVVGDHPFGCRFFTDRAFVHINGCSGQGASVFVHHLAFDLHCLLRRQGKGENNKK